MKTVDTNHSSKSSPISQTNLRQKRLRGFCKMKPPQRQKTVPTNTQTCPVCGQKVEHNSRYPRYLCRVCANVATDKSGRLLEFGNTHFSGGFKATYADTGRIRRSHICFIKGIRCWADEARFGGIVIQVIDAQGKARMPAQTDHERKLKTIRR